MTIHYATDTEFYDGILECVRRGLTFTAQYAQMKITLLGGY